MVSVWYHVEEYCGYFEVGHVGTNTIVVWLHQQHMVAMHSTSELEMDAQCGRETCCVYVC